MAVRTSARRKRCTQPHADACAVVRPKSSTAAHEKRSVGVVRQPTTRAEVTIAFRGRRHERGRRGATCGTSTRARAACARRRRSRRGRGGRALRAAAPACRAAQSRGETPPHARAMTMRTPRSPATRRSRTIWLHGEDVGTLRRVRRGETAGIAAEYTSHWEEAARPHRPKARTSSRTPALGSP